MDYDLVPKSRTLTEELPESLWMSGNKNELVARVFSAMENNVMPVKSKGRFKERI